MADVGALRAALCRLGPAVLGFSGGVDSSLLAVVAAEALGPDRFLAVIGLSPSFPAVQRSAALDLAARFGIPVLELATSELEDPRYAANAPDRCYYCKTELWHRLRQVADQRGFTTVLDGTNADELAEHRPGLKAGAELAVRSPLAELGWRKADVRAAARSLGIPGWDALAAPCLASRVRYGVTVTPARLRQIEAAETFLRSLGVEGDLRVRHLGARARVEVDPSQFALVDSHWDDIRQRLSGLGFAAVERDPSGYRRGSLLALAPGG